MCFLVFCGISIAKLVTKHQADFKKAGIMPQLRARHCFVLGLSEWFSKCFVMTWRPVFASSWWFIGSLTHLFFLSAGGWVALRWIHQGGLLQPWKVWGGLRLNYHIALSLVTRLKKKNKFEWWCPVKDELGLLATLRVTVGFDELLHE